jgi:hypothetical protein
MELRLQLGADCEPLGTLAVEDPEPAHEHFNTAGAGHMGDIALTETARDLFERQALWSGQRFLLLGLGSTRQTQREPVGEPSLPGSGLSARESDVEPAFSRVSAVPARMRGPRILRQPSRTGPRPP